MVTGHYTSILAKSSEALTQLSSDQERFAKFTAAHNDADELDRLGKLMAGRAEEHMYQLARIEYQHALFALAFAQYRQAHVSLRLFFELSLSSILFSAHEIDAHLWLKGKKDSNWSAISSKETGVFSKNFVSAFFEDMKDFCEQYHALAVTLYRECSEYVHGNRQSYEGIDAEIVFNQENTDGWLDRSDTARLVVKFAFLCRYMPHVSAEMKQEFQDMILENFSAFGPMRDINNGAMA
tara:strand:- start:106 stop:819 length:714 start_codon:yes stop_codon:yes gene_type:complete